MTERPLRILQVSTHDVAGGAEQIARALFQVYRARGLEAWMAVGYRHGDDPDVYEIPNAGRHGAWPHFWWGAEARLRALRHPRQLDRRAVWRLSRPWSALCAALADAARALALPGRSLGVEDFNFPGTRRLLQLPPRKPDIVHAHNLHGDYFDLRALPWLSEQTPVVLTLHDAWLLSGHCAHAFACTRWETGCGQCPDLTIPPAVARDATAFNWRRKRRVYARSRLYVATPSRWLMDRVARSMLAPAIAEARVIPNGVDLTVFAPADRRAARAALSLPPDDTTLLFMAQPENPWKDHATLRAALPRIAERLRGEAVRFVALGMDAPTEQIGAATLTYAPFTRDPATLARYYQAADVYVHATKADTFPTAVLEALACGAPVVATAVGGIPEQVTEGVTGFLAPPGDAEALAGRAASLLADAGVRQRFSAAAAADARARFDRDRMVDDYLGWYGTIVARWFE